MKRVAIVPVKRLSQAKMRLSLVLTPKERKAISEMMLKDILEALKDSDMLDDVIVIGSDTSVKRLAKVYRGKFLKEPSTGLNMSIEYATKQSRKNGATSLLVALADIPLVNKTDIEQVIGLGLDAAAVISPSRAEGTNALLRTPPDVIQTEYGIGVLSITLDVFKKEISFSRYCGLPLCRSMWTLREIFGNFFKGVWTRIRQSS